MKKHQRISSCLLALMLTVFLSACGNQEMPSHPDDAKSQDGQVQTVSASEDYFEWDGDIIVDLTESGAQQTELVIPKRCKGFADSIFLSPENQVKSVSFESNEDVDLNGVFEYADRLENVTLPSGLTTLSPKEFSSCESLQKITIPAGVTEIPKYAFKNNTALKEVVFEGDITSIGDHAFEKCTSLTAIDLPASLSQMGEYAFCQCSSLDNIVLPDAVTQISGHLFEGCSSLSGIELKNTITSIGRDAFYQCTALKEVTLPAGLTELGDTAFALNGLEKVTVPAEMTLTKYGTAVFGQEARDVSVTLTAGSWADQNFNDLFGEECPKNYSE